ncbi:MAG: nucleoside triphosphate pyrophosphohydrolase [Sphaerospermopsis kisseleviana]
MSNTGDTGLERLLRIMDELREQCPWDRKQTIHSLRSLTIEETYELAESITASDWNGIREELGDLLLHIVFYAKIASEEKTFSLKEVIDTLCDKLIRRHPHIYGEVKVSGEEEVKQNWEKIKLSEGKRTSVMEGVPSALPAMVKSARIQDKARQAGFDWSHAGQVWDKVQEELAELKEAVESGDKDRMEEEAGDVFFSLINYSRFLQLDPENALERTNRKFLRRFGAMEQLARSQNRTLSEMTLDEMDELWNQIKAHPTDHP